MPAAKYLREAKAREVQAENGEDKEKQTHLSMYVKRLTNAESLLKGYRNFLEYGPSIDVYGIYKLALDNAKREPKVTIRVPDCIKFQLHTGEIAAKFGKPGTIELLSRAALTPLMAPDDIEAYQRVRIREGFVPLLRGGGLKAQRE